MVLYPSYSIKQVIMAGEFHWKKEMLILRGPFLVIICSLFLFLPILLQVTSRTMIAVSGLIIGFLITIGDVSHLVRISLSPVHEMVHSAATTVVLDELISLIVCICGGVCGGVATIGGIYSTPFISAEHRVKMVQSVLPHNVDARTILLSPGGLWSVIHEEWVQRFGTIWRGGRGGDSDTDMLVYRSRYDVQEDDTPPPLDSEYHEETFKDEMIWDDSAGHTDTGEDPGVYINDALDVARCGLPCETIDEPITIRADYGINEPVQSCYETGREVVLEMARSVFNEVNEKYLRNICLSSVLGLVFQMKLSGVARNNVTSFFQGSLTATLATLAVGTFSTIELKRSIMNANTVGCDKENKEINILIHNRAIDTLKNALNLLQKQIRMDAQFRQRWRGLLTIMVLYYFRSRKQRLANTK